MQLSPRRFQIFFSILGAFGVFYQFGLYQSWRTVPAFAQVPLSVGLSVFGLLAVGMFLGVMRACQPENTKPLHVPRIDLLVIVFITLASWSVWSLPKLFYPLQTIGDEDYHFETTVAVQEYFRGFLRGSPLQAPGPNMLRYPTLMYALYAIAPNIELSNPLCGFYQRLPLLAPFLAFPPIVYIFATAAGAERRLRLLCSCVVATSSVLLAYTSDKYLDIGHPVLFFTAFAALYLGVTRDRGWLIISLWSAALLPLVRDNALPTSAVIAGIVCISELLTKRIISAFLLPIVATAPGIGYYVLKSLGSSVDSARLSITNLYLQKYDLFFEYLPFYVPWALLVLVTAALYSARSLKDWLVLLGFAASVAGQLLIYSLFEPGWMPWSRNYLMFYGQFVALAVIAISALKIGRFKSIAAILLSLNIFSNLLSNFTQLSQNKLFHEVAIVYRYDHLFDFLRSRFTDLNTTQKIAMSVPAAVPRAFTIYEPPPTITFENVLFDKSPVDWRSFMTFEEFLKKAPMDADLLLFHWRDVDIKLSVTVTHIRAPTEQELLPFEVLFHSDDPLSDGRNGMILLRRK